MRYRHEQVAVCGIPKSTTVSYTRYESTYQKTDNKCMDNYESI
jgi:hypothetical protein